MSKPFVIICVALIDKAEVTHLTEVLPDFLHSKSGQVLQLSVVEDSLYDSHLGQVFPPAIENHRGTGGQAALMMNLSLRLYFDA